MRNYDVVVVGAGPAGSLAARACARGGAEVLLVERRRLPRWKVCGGCLGPGALAALRAACLADLPHAYGAVPLRAMTLVAGGRRASVRLDGNLALSRATLDRALAEAAVESGVEVIDGVRASLDGHHDDAVTLSLQETSDTREGVGPVHAGLRSVRARVVIDAAGLASGPGRAAVDERVSARARVGLGAVFASTELPGLRRGDLRMVVGRSGYVGMVRVEDGVVNVAAAVTPESLSGGGPVEAVRRILLDGGVATIDGDPLEGWRGTPPLTRRPHRVAERRIFRIGDAAGYVEPFTGEGMGWAMASGLSVAPLVGEALSGWRDAIGRRWARRHRSTIRRGQRLCRLLSVGLRSPALVALAVRALEQHPRLADPLVRWGGRSPLELARP